MRYADAYGDAMTLPPYYLKTTAPPSGRCGYVYSNGKTCIAAHELGDYEDDGRMRYSHAFVASEDAEHKCDVMCDFHDHRPTAPREQEAEAQRQSFAYGNVSIENPAVTKEMVAEEAEKLRREGAITPTPSAPTALKALDAKHPPLWEGYEYRPVDHHHWCGCTDLHPDYAWERRKIAVLEDWTHFRDPIKPEEGS